MRPIAQLDGEAGFAEIFLDDVFVPDADVLGGVGEAGTWRWHGRQRARPLAALPRAVLRRRRPARRAATPPVPDARLADEVVDAWIDAEAYRLFTWGTVTRLADGQADRRRGSVNKIFWSELDIALHETALDLLGPDAELAGTWMDGYLFSLAGPIYAGTNEIQRNIVAERLLGLPREVRG